MKDRYHIVQENNFRSTLTIHPELAKMLKIESLIRGIVRFGCRREFVEIVQGDTGSVSQIFLSKNIIDELLIPTFADYQIKIANKEIILGPFIGILKSEGNSTSPKFRSKIYEFYAGEYSNLAGALVLFSLSGVDRANNTVQGYCFDPLTADWKSGIFPYPAAIYRKVGLNREWKNHFLSVLGDTLFNNYHFNKWEMFCWLSTKPEVAKHLPATELYLDKKQLLRLLERYRVLYLKPVSGMKGIGVIQAQIHGHNVLLRWREKTGNREITLQQNADWNLKELKNIRPGKYILQEPINLLRYQNRLIDFRVILQKDNNIQWINQGVIARLGAPGSVVSNISNGGTAQLAAQFMKDYLGYNEAHSNSLLEGLHQLALNAAKSLDSVGLNCGTLGMDIGMDNSGHLWIIEINNRDPDPTIALDAGDTQLYRRLCLTPLYYAKALSGFSTD